MSDASTPPSPPPGAVFELSERAAEFVRRTLNVPLDYTPETLPALDQYLRMVPTDQPATVELVAIAGGAYFGEVCRRLLGGRWQNLKAEAQREWRVELPGGVSFSPIGFVAEAILHESLEDYDGGFDVPDDKREMVEAALDLKGEIPEDEYYSPSGRLEALIYVVEVCVTGEVPKDESPDDDDDDDEATRS